MGGLTWSLVHNLLCIEMEFGWTGGDSNLIWKSKFTYIDYDHMCKELRGKKRNQDMILFFFKKKMEYLHQLLMMLRSLVV